MLTLMVKKMLLREDIEFFLKFNEKVELIDAIFLLSKMIK